MATVGKGTHRMPLETTAEYSRFRSMGKQGIKEKERKGKEHHRRKGQKKGRGYDKKEQVPPQSTNTWLQWGKEHIECPWKLQQNTADSDQWAKKA